MSAMTVGELSRALANFDPQGFLPGVTAEYSIGDHSGISLTPGDGVKVLTLRKFLGAISSRRFTNGGAISTSTPVHLAPRGEIGLPIVGISPDCTILVEED